MALTLARLARETLASEYNLVLSKLSACKQELTILQDAVDEALVFLNDADHQVARIINILNSSGIDIPKYPLPFSASNPTFERPDNLFCYSTEEKWESSCSEDSFGSCDGDGGYPSDLSPSSPR